MVRVEVEGCETEEEVEIETDTGVFSDEQIAYLTPIVKERFGKDIDFKKITSEDVDFLEYNLTDEEKEDVRYLSGDKQKSAFFENLEQDLTPKELDEFIKEWTKRQIYRIQNPFEAVCGACSYALECEIKRDWPTGKYAYLAVCNRKVAAELASYTGYILCQKGRIGAK